MLSVVKIRIWQTSTRRMCRGECGWKQSLATCWNRDPRGRRGTSIPSCRRTCGSREAARAHRKQQVLRVAKGTPRLDSKCKREPWNKSVLAECWCKRVSCHPVGNKRDGKVFWRYEKNDQIWSSLRVLCTEWIRERAWSMRSSGQLREKGGKVRLALLEMQVSGLTSDLLAQAAC